MNDGSQYHRLETERIGKERNLGRTLYGWEGDRLAWESRDGRSLHYFYEPDSFVPLAQGIDNRPIVLHRTPDWKNREYRVKDDPLWQQHPEAEPFDELAFYHCDQIGTPREMTDGEGKLVWSAHYRAWGEAGILTEKVRNPLRFQGQYYDHETGLHYNRHRYYDPESGRYISKDPIGLAGGLNLYAYAPNPVRWVDPRGLAGCIFTLSTGRLVCAPSNSQNLPVDIAVASGNNAVNGSNGQPCRNNSTCTAVPNHGPIPLGKWRWVLYSSQPGQSGYTGKPNGRVLEPVPGTNTNITEQRTLIRSHSCAYPFGPGLGPRFCSEGCVTGTASDIQRLNQLLDAEPNSILEVVAQPLQPQSSQTPTQ
jgi:RHS repeat-associated protein